MQGRRMEQVIGPLFPFRLASIALPAKFGVSAEDLANR